MKTYLSDKCTAMLRYCGALAKWMLVGALIGSVGGLIGSAFHMGVDFATTLRLNHPWVLYLMPVGGLAIVGLYKLAKTEGKAAMPSS